MIPAVIPPLTSLTVLVTRPAAQAAVLAANIRELGGEAIVQPAMEIRPVAASAVTGHQLVIFVSVNAVEHGARYIEKTATMRIAAIGKATAAALAAIDMPADIVPDAGFDSEALLAHPDLVLPPDARILIVRGSGGRELMRETFAARGCAVEILDVYERVVPPLDEQQRAELEATWAAGAIDIATITSVETLRNLFALLTEQGRELLKDTPLVVASRRIAHAAAEMGVRAECVVAAAADDQSMIGALAQWHARARLR